MRVLFAACLMATALVIPGAIQAKPPSVVAVAADETLETVTFPLLAMLRSADGWAAALRSDPGLRELAADRARRVPAGPCTPAPRCFADPWDWTAADISTIEARLRLLMRDPGLARALVARRIRPSGTFGRYAGLGDGDLVAAAWKSTAAAMNRVVAVYAKGEPPRYPKIDAIIFDIASPDFAEVLDAHGTAITAQQRPDDLIFDPSLRYAAGLLRMNERTDAARYRPLLGGENDGAVRKIARTDWKAAPYTALLIFGHGPEDPVSRTGVMGHIRLEIAADLYARGMAPYLIVSGGNVHPNRTPFNEAVEMKRILVSDYGVPADRVLIEPHARHTTTNLRNSARLLIAAGFPKDKPALVVSDPRTIAYIGSAVMAERNLREMGIQPGKLAPGPNRFSLRFAPDAIAFQEDAADDPLDP